MICFHSLNYWYLQQQVLKSEYIRPCCDLLSFFELLIFTTTPKIIWTCHWWLWFAFILWTTDIYNNQAGYYFNPETVVICFHSLNYWYLQQPNTAENSIAEVVICFHSLNYWYLQQQFDKKSIGFLVVICFHSLNYWYLQQQISVITLVSCCCDLLSFFELLIFTTTVCFRWCNSYRLWFAFILWTTDIYNNFWIV